MKAILSILFLSLFLVSGSNCQSTATSHTSNDCSNKKFQDSLITRYADNGAEKLPYLYNNPLWETYFDTVISICPGNATAYQLKAIPALKNGEFAKAFQLNEQAAALEPQQFIPYLGFLKCIFTKDYHGAILDFEKANKIIPGGGEMDHTFYFYLGICYMQLGNSKEAIRNFEKDISFQKAMGGASSVHFNSLLFMGLTQSDENEPDSAISYLKQSLKIYPQLPEANYYLALIYKKKREFTNAGKYFEIAGKSILDGYNMNEDNLYYVNYPRQITFYEVNQQLALLKSNASQK